MHPLPELLTVRDVAGVLSVSTRTIYLWIKQGKLPVVRTPGGQIRIPRAAVQREATTLAPPERSCQDAPGTVPHSAPRAQRKAGRIHPPVIASHDPAL